MAFVFMRMILPCLLSWQHQRCVYTVCVCMSDTREGGERERKCYWSFTFQENDKGREMKEEGMMEEEEVKEKVGGVT